MSDRVRDFPDSSLVVPVGNGRYILTSRGRLILFARCKYPGDLTRQVSYLKYQDVKLTLQQLADAHFEVDMLLHGDALDMSAGEYDAFTRS